MNICQNIFHPRLFSKWKTAFTRRVTGTEGCVNTIWISLQERFFIIIFIFLIKHGSHLLANLFRVASTLWQRETHPTSRYVCAYPRFSVHSHPRGSGTTRDRGFCRSSIPSLHSVNFLNQHHCVRARVSSLPSKPEGLNSHWRRWGLQCDGDLLVPLHYHRTPSLVTIRQLLEGNNTPFVNVTLLLERFS